MTVEYAVARNFIRYLKEEKNWAIKDYNISENGNDTIITLKNGTHLRFHVVTEEETIEEPRKVLNCPYCLRHQSMKLQSSRNSFYHRYKCDFCDTMVLVSEEETK